MMKKLHLYTGDGKGKTTAAMGLALRCLGHGGRVLVGQFVKDGTSGELMALRQMSGVTVLPCPPMKGFATCMTEDDRAAAAQEHTKYAHALIRVMEDVRPDCVILDELAMALTLGMVPADAAQALIEAALRHGETVVTGYAAPAWLHDRADYVTRMSAQKHPYKTENLPARRGVEW